MHYNVIQSRNRITFLVLTSLRHNSIFQSTITQCYRIPIQQWFLYRDEITTISIISNDNNLIPTYVVIILCDVYNSTAVRNCKTCLHKTFQTTSQRNEFSWKKIIRSIVYSSIQSRYYIVD